MAKTKLMETLKGMTFRERAEYLWEYYWWILLVTAFAVIVIAMVVTGIVNTSGEVLYSGAAVNVPLSEEGREYLTQELEEHFGAEKNQKTELFATSFDDLRTASDVEVSSAAAMQVVLMITAEDFDYVLMDEVAFSFYKNHPVFTPLNEMFGQETLTQWDASVVYHETEEAGKYPIALDITDTGFVRDCAPGSGRIYIAFPGNTGRTNKNADFLAYLLNWK